MEREVVLDNKFSSEHALELFKDPKRFTLEQEKQFRKNWIEDLHKQNSVLYAKIDIYPKRTEAFEKKIASNNKLIEKYERELKALDSKK